MLQIGEYNRLKVLRETKVGLFLGDEEQDVLLPKKYIPKEFFIGDEMNVFIYLDHEERPVATTLKPYVKLNEFAHLKVNYINKFGAFLDWGLEKDLFVPFKEQAKPMEVGKRYLIYAYLDEKTNRLAATSKVQKYFATDVPDYEPNEEVEVMISHITDMGINVIIENRYKGLAYADEVFKDIKLGKKTKAYIKQVRPDGKIDVTFTKIGLEAIDDDAQVILKELKANNGFLGLHDKSHPEEIKTILQMSKKAFKKAVGSLYKARLIDIKDNGIFLV
ncbi:S1-like domain-containing RNA-binding protein [Flavobacterium sp. NRK F10]|uniref:GntR family transcriptional regulator n=1 Tax=Flavobacterium sediminis TaxID=2201181 RepID=A0A2U8QYD1_9FLAO|nr:MULTISPECIES: S1-like domain-containing RNA-binding protein [Flavobacterium]AWM15162.1 GntR family transcriptional regulator [Flavobacterium sediminis]MCO6176450.1 S1-like domain-containing RNA-binding protein [Flavobacterium sp. NRK F10]